MLHVAPFSSTLYVTPHHSDFLLCFLDMESCNRPPVLNLHDEDISDSFRKWKRQMELFLLASGASSKPKSVQAAIILNCAGPQAIGMFDQLDFAEGEDKNDPNVVMKKLIAACSDSDNEVLQAYKFWEIPLGDPFDEFLTSIRKQAGLYHFADKDRMLHDNIFLVSLGYSKRHCCVKFN